VVFSLVFQIFEHPCHLWGRVNSGDIIVLTFVFDIFVPQSHLVIFSNLFKLKPDITCIDLIGVTILLFRVTMAEFIKWYKL
jgi:hypothetical protein